MRYPASEKLEIIRLVEQSHLPTKRTIDTLGIPRTTFYRWYDKYLDGGIEALEDRSPKPSRVWNRIPDDVRQQIVEMALDDGDLSPRELAVKFTDTKRYFVSEASVYRLLKARNLITSPAYVVIKAADEFRDKTTAINQMWQTDFTYIKIIGWGWFYLSTILDDYSRYVVAWKLCTTMKTSDVTDTLELALQASGCDQVAVRHKPRLLSDNGASYVSGELADWLAGEGMDHVRGAPYHPQTQGKIERCIRPSRTAFCWRTTSYRAISTPVSSASSSIIIITDIMRACRTSRPLMFTSGAKKPFYSNGKGLNATHSNSDACNTAIAPLNINQRMSQSLA